MTGKKLTISSGYLYNNLDLYDIRRIKNKATLNKQPMTIYEFQQKNNQNITRENMKKISQDLLSEFRKNNADGIVSVSIEYPDRWYSANVSHLDEDIDYFSYDNYDVFSNDPNNYRKFRFTFIPIVNGNMGGLDEHNDCLINCIKKFIINPIEKGKIRAEEIKSYLGIDRDDMISIDMISKVEKYINKLLSSNYSIMISGDAEYISDVKSNKVIRLVLSKNHYSLDSSLNRVKGRSHEEKKILMYEWNDNNECDVFDGENLYTLTEEQFIEYNNNPISCPYLLIPKGYTAKAKQLEYLEQAYEKYIKMANIMKEKTNGRINFYKTGTIKKTALNYFYEMMKSVQPDPISNNEAKWIEESTFGALTYWEPYKGNVYSYDRNSHYPNTLRKNYHYFPIKEGQYITMTEDDFKKMYDDNFKDFGIYRCIIDKPKNTKAKFFRFNHKNKYTHLDLQCAKEYGFDIQLIIDGKPNCLYYSKDKLMNGAYLFKKYVDELYELKTQKIDGAKDLLNILWGGLCEMNYYNKNIDYDEDIDYTDADLRKINSTDDELQIKCLFYKGGYFKTNFARMKPFVISYGRKDMFKSFKQYEELIVRLHTDGIYLKEPLTGLDELDSNKIGYIAFEGIKDVHITGLNAIVVK